MSWTLRPWFRWTLQRSFVALALYAPGYTALNVVLTQRVERGLDAIAARGEPVESFDIPTPEVPAERDAGPFFRASCELWRGLEHEWEQRFGVWLREDGRWADAVFEPLDDARRLEARTWYDRHPTLRLLLNELAQRPTCGTDVDMGPTGPLTPMLDLVPARQLARAQSLGAWLDAGEGRLDQAVERVCSIFDLARCVQAQRYSVIAVVIANAITDEAIDALRALLEHDLGPRHLAQLGSALDRSAYPIDEAFRDAMLGERAATGVYCFQTLLQGRENTLNPKGVAARGPVRLLLLDDFATYLRFSGLSVDQPELFGVGGRATLPPHRAVLTCLLLPGSGALRSQLLALANQRRLARVALALCDRVTRGGELPLELEPTLGPIDGMTYTRGPEGAELSLPNPATYPVGDEPLRFAIPAQRR